jgi:hypothetical protein
MGGALVGPFRHQVSAVASDHGVGKKRGHAISIDVTFDFRTDVTGKNPDPGRVQSNLAALPPTAGEQAIAVGHAL